MASFSFSFCVVCALTAWWCVNSRADTFYTMVVSSGGSATGPAGNWSDLIWTNTVVTTPVGPTNGNTYETVNNGVTISPTGASSTRVRTPTNFPAAIIVFPGDSLTVNADTEIFCKQQKFVNGVSSSKNPTVYNFPGTNGNPGLILNGGILFTADGGVTFQITGAVQVASISYMCAGVGTGNPGNGAGSGRAFEFSGYLFGSGDMVWFGATNTPSFITGRTNTFSGRWIVQNGWVVGTNKYLAPNSPNPLGTNSVTCDPQYGFPQTDWNLAQFINPLVYQARIESGYDWNNAGTLILTNGGQMLLHQNDCFVAATISTVNFQGGGQPLTTNLSPGTHFYAELRANYPDVFPSGGSGAITIRPYSTANFPPPLGPQVLTQPVSVALYAGEAARFSATASGPPTLVYHWQRSGTNLIDGGNISGSTTTSLTVSNVSATDAANYDMVVTNSGGAATSSVVSLSIVASTGEASLVAVSNANPVAFYQFNETGNPVTNNTLAFDYIGGHTGVYGTNCNNGFNNVMGPTSPTFPGFAANNFAAQPNSSFFNSRVTAPPLNLNTNAVTITAWINPLSDQASSNGLVMCRGGSPGTTAGLRYTTFTDVNGNHTLGYIWNNDFPTVNWDSGIPVPAGQWSFVALAVTPANATIYLLNANGLAASTLTHTHGNQAFAATTQIGGDSNDGDNGTESFSGTMDDVAFFNSSLSQTQIVALYIAGAGGSGDFPPYVAGQPKSQTLYEGQSAQFQVIGGSSQPLVYQWQAGPTNSGIFTNLSDTGQISGSATLTLNLNNLSFANIADFRAVLSNSLGSATSGVATLTVVPPAGAGTNWVWIGGGEAFGTDWDTGSQWAQGYPTGYDGGTVANASTAAVAYPGSTFEIMTNGSVRSPSTVQTATFPGVLLMIDGKGVVAGGGGGGGTGMGELKLKADEVASPGTVTFNHLVLNGGQIDDASPGSPGAGTWPNPINTTVCIIAGQLEVATNSVIYNDNSGSQIVDRGPRINAWLTGAGALQYAGYQAAFQDNFANAVLNIAGASNTFSGQWDVASGVLLGSALNSLGTNTITIESDGALETTYDISNPTGSLIVNGNGRVYLHQNDYFGYVSIKGTNLANGVYTWAQLNAAYPANFPATWTQQSGSSFSTASGSITVGIKITLQSSGANLVLKWSAGTLLEATNVTGPWATNDNTSPYTISPTNAMKFYRVQVQ